MLECSVISPGLIDGNDGNKSVSSILHASFDDMKFAWVPMVEVMKCVVFLIWSCSIFLLCFLHEKKWSPYLSIIVLHVHVILDV